MAKSDKYIYSVLLNFLFIKESWKKIKAAQRFFTLIISNVSEQQKSILE